MSAKRLQTKAGLEGVVRRLVYLSSAPLPLSDADRAEFDEVVAALLEPLPTYGVWGMPDYYSILQPGIVHVPIEPVLTELRKAFEFVVNQLTTLAMGACAVAVRFQLVDHFSGRPAARHLLAISGPARDVLLSVVFQILSHDPLTRLLRCPECQRIFYKTGRRTHCSDRCYDTWYWREKYGPERKRRARQKQYDANGWTLGSRKAGKKTARKKGTR